MSKTLIWVVAALGLGFVAGAWWMDARRAPEIAALEAALGAQMIGDLAALGGATRGPQLPGLAPDAGVAPAPVTPARVAPAPASASTAPPATSTPRGQLPPEVAELIGRLQAMDRDFEAQKRDPTWAEAQERALNDLYAASSALLPPDAALVGIDCRTTLCRLSLGGLPKGLRPDQPNPMAPFAQMLGAHRYGVHWSIQGRPAEATDLVVFTLRPEALFQQPEGR